METVSGVNNWKLTIRREREGITLLRAETCDERAALPEELFGLPVTALGDHAMTPHAREETGESVLVTCGLPAEPDWNNRRLQELTLPASLRRMGDYALLNCDGLKTLRLHDSIAVWGGAALMNCRRLDTFYLTQDGSQGESLAYFADELSRELDVTIFRPSGTVRLVFPEYIEVYEENCPAHHFDYNIYGAGYPYHHCFRQKRLNLKDYDDLWPAYLGTEHDDGTALRLAWWRLWYPADLTGPAEEGYLAYLRAHAREAARWRLLERDPAGLRFLLAHTPWDRDMLAELCALAREQDAPEALALLLEEQHKRWPTGAEKSFEL